MMTKDEKRPVGDIANLMAEFDALRGRVRGRHDLHEAIEAGFKSDLANARKEISKWATAFGTGGRTVDEAIDHVRGLERVQASQSAEIVSLKAQLRRGVPDGVRKGSPPEDGREYRVWFRSAVVQWKAGKNHWVSNGESWDYDPEFYVMHSCGCLPEPPPKEPDQGGEDADG